MIYHVFTSYTPPDPETARRHEVARQTWAKQPWREVPVFDAMLPRTFRERERAMPFVRDMLDIGVAATASDEDIVVYTNSDIMVRGDACPIIAAALQSSDAVYAYRRDFHHRVLTPIPDGDFVKGLDYAGSDLVAFRAGWWKHWREEMPDMLIAAEAWDPVMRQLVDETNPNAQTQVRDVICHERHGTLWENPVTRYKLKMQWHNFGLAKAFFLERGIDPRRFYIP